MPDAHSLRRVLPDLPLAVRVGIVAVVALGCLALAPSADIPLLRLILIAIAGTLITVLAGMMLVWLSARFSTRWGRQTILASIANDPAPMFLTDHAGYLHHVNAAGRALGLDGTTISLPDYLRSTLADPAGLLERLQLRAEENGSAVEDISGSDGLMRLSVMRAGPEALLWRVERMPATGSVGARRLAATDLPLPVLTADASGQIVFANEAARALAGRRVSQIDSLFAGKSPVSGDINVIKTAAGKLPVAVAELPGDGNQRNLVLLPARAATDTPDPGFAGLPVPLLKIAPDGRILTANDQALQLLGGSLNEGAMVGDVMQGLGRPISDWLRDTIASGGTQKSEFLRVARKDTETFVQVTMNAIKEKGEDLLIAVLTDATELKTLEAQFVQSQKMQAIGQLAGGVAHDFNNLLTAISGHCDLLLLRHDQGDQDYGDLVQINQNANRAAALVTQLLAFSRKQTLMPEVLDLRETLSDLTHLLNRLVGEKVTLTLSHDPVLRAIRADKRQLEQVLLNLVVNARDAMPQGGDIRIDTEILLQREPLERDRATVPPGEYVTVRVSDNGTGIAPDKLSKIFEPFYTTKRTGEGTGLGLSTAYGIVKQSGGFIFVDSTLGDGTTFTLYLPAYDAVTQGAEAEPPPVKAKPAGRGDGVVLLVEDEAPVRAFASRALRLRGYTVLEAESAEDALRTLDDPDLKVDIFVTDVVMPGMDGPTWVRKALETRPDVRVVFVSGYAEDAFGDYGHPVPNSVFLPKPFSLSQLTDTVHQQLA